MEIINDKKNNYQFSVRSSQIFKIENTRINIPLAVHKKLSLILFARQYFHQSKLSNELVKTLGQHSPF